MYLWTRSPGGLTTYAVDQWESMNISSKHSCGPLDNDQLHHALDALRETGYVVFESVLPAAYTVQVREAFDKVLLARFDGRSIPSHGGLQPPMQPPFTDASIIENPLTMQILEAALGPGFFGYLPYGSNTAWPGIGKQHIHRDQIHLFPDTSLVLPVSMAVVNIALVDFTEENGATEVWPGSHLITDTEADQTSDDPNACPEERAARLPSVRMVMPAGSLVVRDMRLWHRGMPNRTDTRRSMLSLVYARAFHHWPDRMPAAGLSDVWETLSDRAKRIYRYSHAPDE